MSRFPTLGFFGLLYLSFTSCSTPPKIAPPPPPPQNYFSAASGQPMRRVAFLPIWNARLPAEYLQDVDSAFSTELAKRALFEIVPISRTQLSNIFGERQLSSVEILPAEALAKLRAQFGVDGVLFTDLTQFSPYRPISMGVRSKLVDAQSGSIRWAFDYVYDTGNGSVAAAAKNYQRLYTNPNLPLPSDGGSILLSPSRFSRYVASETYGTLGLQFPH